MFHRTLLVTVGVFAVLFMLAAGVLARTGSPDGKAGSRFGRITGRVLDGETKTPLVGTNIVVVGGVEGGITDLNGEFAITGLSPGAYVLEFSYIGYRTERIEGVQVPADSDVRLDVELKSQPLRLSEVIVTPGQFAVMGTQPVLRQTLTRQDLQTVPFGEDVYRAITRLPGVSSGDFSARFTVRGGKSEEVLVLMDGQELYEPFHLKDVDGGIFSIIDVEAIGEVDLHTGGYPAEYGECMSGVFSMKSGSAGDGQSRTALGISLMNARLMSQGDFRAGRGSWLLSARRGYLDLVLSLMGEEDAPQPVYYDLFGKVKYRINNHTVSANILHSSDRLVFEEDDGDEVSTSYGNSYGWLTWTAVMKARMFARTIASFGSINHNRQGIGYFDDDGGVEFTVSDDNRVSLFGLKQDWHIEMSERWLLRSGFYFGYETADYDYMSTAVRRNRTSGTDYSTEIDTTSADLYPEGERFGGYLAGRFQVSDPLTAEIGLRCDRNAYTDDRYLSPRINAVYALGKQTFLRAGWGHFHQSQRMHDIRVAYGETGFYPVQLSEHWVAGLEHTLRNGVNLRLEGYMKRASHLRPDHRNFSNSVEVFPEIEEDAFSLTFDGAESKGLEFYLKYDRGGEVSCWAGYGLAYADEDVRTLTYEGEEFVLDEPVVPNRYDQRHTVFLDFNYRPSRNWHLNVSWQYHSGWPYTRKVLLSRQLSGGGTEYYTEWEELYGSRFSAYHRMDVQINRHFYLSRSRISLFLAVINVYDHANIRNIKYSQRIDSDGIPYLVETEEYWFPLLPSLGVSWTLMH